MRRGSPLTRRVLLLGLAALLGVQTAYAQDLDEAEGPVFGVRRRPPKFGMGAIHGNVNLDMIMSKTTQDAKTSGSSESSNTVFRELLTLETTAYIVHPNLLDFNLGGTLGLAQTSFDYSDNSGLSESGDQNDQIYGWNVEGMILKNQKLSGSLYTNQSQSYVSQSFGPTFESTDTSYGATLNYNDEMFPTTLRLSRIEQEQRDMSNDELFHNSQNLFDWNTEARFSPTHGMTWNYIYSMYESGSETRDGIGITSEADAQTMSLSHYIGFGGRKQYTLTSAISYTEVTGDSPSETQSWTERLRANHTNNFFTEYSYLLNQQSYPGLDQSFQLIDARFEHRWYQSLTTVGRIGVIENELSDDSTSTEHFASLDLSYYKKVPHGRLISDLSLGFRTRESEAFSDPITVRNQPFQFINYDPYRIDRQDIDADSIVVKDLAGRAFSRIVDYSVHEYPSYIELWRTPGGAIRDNQQLLLDYSLLPEPAYTLEDTAFSWSARYNIEEGPLRGLSPYFRYYMLDESISSDQPTAIKPDSIDEYTIGVEFSRGPLFLQADHQIHDSTLMPYTADRFRGRYSGLILPDTRLTLDGSLVMISYEEEPSYESRNTHLAGTVDQQVGRNWTIRATVAWLQIDDDRAGNTDGLEEQLEVRWRYRQVEAYLLFRNSDLSNEYRDENFQLLMIGVKREF